MNLRSISALAVITALGACGGSSDGSAVNPVRPPVPAPVPAPIPEPIGTVLKTFVDGSGILRSPVTVTDSVTGEVFSDVANMLTSNVNFKVNGVYRNEFSIIDENGPASDPQPGGLNGLGTEYVGDIRINGVLVPGATLIYDNAARSWIMQTGTELIAGGRKSSGVPIGEMTYQGSNIYTDANGTQYGTFDMIVDFDTQVGTINATTGSTRLSGPIQVSNQDATFLGNSLGLNEASNNPVDADTITASIRGNFHGSGSTQTDGVSGIYFDNRSTPSAVGAIAGSAVPISLP